MTPNHADLGNLAARNAELRRLFVKPTIRLTDEDSPGVFAVYRLDESSRQERLLDRIPGEALARLLAWLPDAAGPDAVELAIRSYRAGPDTGPR